MNQRSLRSLAQHSPAAPGHRPLTQKRKRSLREAGTGLAFIFPALLGLLALYIWPLLTTVVVSLSITGPFGNRKPAGLSQYAKLSKDPEFWGALQNSVIYSAIVLIGIPIAVLIAVMIHNVRRGASIYRVLFFLPVVTLPVAIGMVWRLSLIHI